MEKIHLKKRQKNESLTTYSSHSMAARMSLSAYVYAINFVIKVSMVINVIAQCIVSIRTLYLVHVFSNLSKEPFLVAVCCISL